MFGAITRLLDGSRKVELLALWFYGICFGWTCFEGLLMPLKVVPFFFKKFNIPHIIKLKFATSVFKSKTK